MTSLNRFVSGMHVHRGRKLKRAKGLKPTHTIVRTHLRRLRAPKVMPLPDGFQLKSPFDSTIDVLHRQAQDAARAGYVLKHVGEAGDVPGQFTSSLPEFKQTFAQLADAGLVTVKEHPTVWSAPTADSWGVPTRRQTASITDLGIQRLSEDDRTIAELFDDWKGGASAAWGDAGL